MIVYSILLWLTLAIYFYETRNYDKVLDRGYYPDQMKTHKTALRWYGIGVVVLLQVVLFLV